MKYIWTAYFILCSLGSFACLNEDHVTKNGVHSIDAFELQDLAFYKHQDIAAIQLVLSNLLVQQPATPDEMRSVKNDIAVQYIKLGKLNDAEDILSELIKKYPGDYSVVINLGTLYELQGKNKAALQLIQKAVAINPDSHNGSEWFHIKILEFKLKNINDDKIASQNILDLPVIKKRAVDIAYEVRYQLEERIPFTPAPNLMMAKVLKEYGDFLADSISIKAAYVMYQIGMDYDKNNLLSLKESRDALVPYFRKYHETVPQTGIYYLDKILPADDHEKVNTAATLLEKGFNYFKEQEEKRNQEARQKQYFLFGGIVLIVALTGIFFYKRKKQAA